MFKKTDLFLTFKMVNADLIFKSISSLFPFPVSSWIILEHVLAY